MNKKIISVVLALAMAFSLGACKNKDKDPDVITSATIPDGYTEYAIRDAYGRTTEGYGAQIDTHIYKNYNAMTDEEMEEFYSRVKEMNIQNIRTQVFPEWYERGNDNADYNSFDYNSANVKFDSEEMLQLFKLLDFCEKEGIKVDLSFYGCQPNFTSQDGQITKSWLASPFTKNWITSPKLVDENGNEFPGLEEFAESVYGLLNYVINTKKYTCVYEFSIFPEPDLSYVTANGSVSNTEYVQLVKKVDEKLKAEGIRDKIIFSGPAATSTTMDFYNRYVRQVGEIFDKYTVSIYKYDDEDTNETLLDYGKAMVSNIDEVNASFGVAEFGSKNVIDAANQEDIDTFERALFLGRFMINLTNAGCTNMKYWEICDMGYGGFMMNLGLWKFRNDNWVARPQYYTWSLITKYTEFGSAIYPIASADGELCAVAFKLPDGTWTYYVCNTSNGFKSVSFVNYNEGYPKAMNVYEVRASKLRGEVKPIVSDKTIDVADGAVNIRVPANSFVCLSTK